MAPVDEAPPGNSSAVDKGAGDKQGLNVEELLDAFDRHREGILRILFEDHQSRVLETIRLMEERLNEACNADANVATVTETLKVLNELVSEYERNQVGPKKWQNLAAFLKKSFGGPILNLFQRVINKLTSDNESLGLGMDQATGQISALMSYNCEIEREWKQACAKLEAAEKCNREMKDTLELTCSALEKQQENYAIGVRELTCTLRKMIGKDGKLPHTKMEKSEIGTKRGRTAGPSQQPKFKIQKTNEEYKNFTISKLRGILIAFDHGDDPIMKRKPLKKDLLALYEKVVLNVVDDDNEDDNGIINQTNNLEQARVVYFPSGGDPTSVEISESDLTCLGPERYLNCTIMNFYLRYLQQYVGPTPSFHFFNTFFYNKMIEAVSCKESFSKFRKWWRGVNLFEKAYVLIPIHKDLHWSLAIICFPDNNESDPIILHLDSLRFHSSQSVFEDISRYLIQEKNILNEECTSSDVPVAETWKNIETQVIKVPQQRNAFDCGLFVLSFVEHFIKDAPERLQKKDLTNTQMFGGDWFTHEDASSLRGKILFHVAELFHKV